ITAETFSDRPGGLIALKNSAVSYGIGTGSNPQKPMMTLVADRNVIGKDGQNCSPAAITGVITSLVPASDRPHWDDKIHQFVGNMGLVDGSVQQLSATDLERHLTTTGDSR
ncbi:MAG TPA: hypothetical protein DCM86_03235, partial [Verrucomicrobiales bacterium]|nr:hypothetical protein [Verrucomicrobiales bacterium]